MKNLPIGFVDSGVGGLTVVKQSLRQLPNESIIYLGDNARCPYGPRPLEEVKRYIWQLTNFLREKGIKMLVIACNTGTAAALDDIRATLAIPVVGVIHPGSRAAIKQTTNNRIGIIGTQGTINSELYETVLTEKVEHLDVTSVACPEFVEIAESTVYSQAEIDEIVSKRMSAFEGTQIDTLVLGCTHYPLLKEAIQTAIGPQVHLIDSGKETINEVSTLLDYFNLSRSAEDAIAEPATQVYYTTGEVEPFKTIASQWLEEAQPNIKSAVIKGEIVVESDYSQS
ncbi:glutamate racemase [Fundicoccus sp. Sow4_D5]|uniref:glutamate racemase n=1 Tax=unclassified Fundicoccus TaxID=2761543 RepID=UPI003F92E6B8